LTFQKNDVCIFGKKGEGKTHYIKNEIIKPSPFPCVIIDTFKEYGDVAIKVPLPVKFPRIAKFKTRFEIDSDVEFRLICYWLANSKEKTPVNLIISEVDWWTSSHYIPDECLKLLICSRHAQINIIVDVRNPTELNRKFTSLCDKFVIFKLTEPRYLKYFGDYDPELISQIQYLPSRKDDTHYKPIIYTNL
jgi:hypothetical protein